MWAVDVGYVLDKSKAVTDDVYASWSPGFAYVWGNDDANWQTFNRFAVGANVINQIRDTDKPPREQDEIE